MIHYVTTTVSGGYIVIAFQDGDVGEVLAKGADSTRFAPCVGHSVHDPAVYPCQCAVSWTERPGTVWEKRGFRWHVKKESKT